MRGVKMFILENCPHCRKAREIMDELCRENAAYAKVEVEVIDEGKEPQIAAAYDYYYVPTFYVDGVKVMEGVPSRDGITKVFAAAIGEK